MNIIKVIIFLYESPEMLENTVIYGGTWEQKKKMFVLFRARYYENTLS